MCLLLAILQIAINSVFSADQYKCGCYTFSNGTKACGPQYSTTDQLPFCAIPDPPAWPAFLQVSLPSPACCSDTGGQKYSME